MPQPDYRRSMVINGLLKDYAAVASCLKTLRAGCPCTQVPCQKLETARAQATEWFNRVCALYVSELLSVADLLLVASPRAAQLWLDHVAPLDRAVREAAQGPDADDVVHPVEQFWRDYAEGRLRVYGVTATPATLQ